MKYISEYRDKDLVQKLISQIKNISRKPVRFMEVCGGHTMAIQRYGIPGLLPDNIELVSGPGCPVCVSHQSFIDTAIEYAKQSNVIIATFGDLIRVPGSYQSLDKIKANGADIRIILSPLDAAQLAIQNPEKKIVFLGIGFETTAPGTAVAVQEAQNAGIKNFFVLSSHKVMPPAMQALVDEGVNISGYLAPGHVSTVTGSNIYNFISEKYNIPVVVSGFEPVDMLQSILMLVKQVESNRPMVEIQYKRAVNVQGNLKAQAILEDVFQLSDDWWRGLGTIQNSGLKLKEKYSTFDALQAIPVQVPKTIEPKGCICGLVLKGKKSPLECKLFGIKCTPENPVGACMVSNEGACHAKYKYAYL